MISNERPSPFGRRFNPRHDRARDDTPRPFSDEETLRTERVQIERKTFVFTLKQNSRGRFLRITEDMKGRRASIIVPATGLGEFQKGIETVAKDAAAGDMPPPAPTG